MADEVETVEPVAEVTTPEPAAHEEAPKIAESTKETLAEKIQTTFDKVMGNDTEEEEPAAAETTAETTEATPAAEEKAETTTTPEAAAPKASTLPAAYVRTLKALEWSDEEIASAGQNAALLPSIAKLHQSRNKELAGWAELGRKTREQQQTTAPAKEAAAKATTLQALTPVEIKALKDQYGDTDGGLVDTIMSRMNPLIEKLQAALPIVEATQARSQQAQADMLNRQITTFFGSKELTPYKDEYGTDAGKLTDKQTGTRQKLLEYADALIGGASMQGRPMSFDEAMQAAHDAVSGGLKEKAARTQVVSQLQQRQRAITVKPGARAAVTKTSVAKTRGELESRVKKGLSSVLG